MKIFNTANIPISYKNSAIAIGNFDGIHRGHQKVFSETKKFAKKNKKKFGILTFSPLPVMFFNKKIRNFRILSESKKIQLINKYGADFIINIKFNKKFSLISAENFIKKIIYKKIKPCSLSVGDNFRFGKNRLGNVNLLKKFSHKYQYELLDIKPFKYNRKVISSTRIRKYLQRGKINNANKLLSRTWSIDGIVKKGKGLGRKLGYRTCNILIKKYILPKTGIYVVKLSEYKKNKIYSAVAYFGSRPTFKGKEIFLEVNIFNFNQNLYKKRLNIYFLKFIRSDKKFKNSTELTKQMKKDVILAKKGLKTKLII